MLLVPRTHARAAELYDPSVIPASGRYVSVENGRLRISADNCGGTEDIFADFAHPSSDSVMPGCYYRVDYTVTAESVQGTCYLILDSANAWQQSQLYLNSQTVTVSECGTFSGTYYTRAGRLQEQETQELYMMRSYAYIPAGSALQCEIEIHVSPEDTLTEEIMDAVVPAGTDIYHASDVELSPDYGTAEADGSLSLWADNTQGAEDRCCNFFHSFSSDVLPGEYYRVEYRIYSYDIAGECYIVLNSQPGQLYQEEHVVPVRETGTVEGSCYIRAGSGAASLPENSCMLRSYVCAPAGSRIGCNIMIHVYRVRSYALTLEALPDGLQLTAEGGTADIPAGMQVQLRVTGEPDFLYRFSLSSSGEAVRFVYDGQTLSFDMPEGNVSLAASAYSLACRVDGHLIHPRLIGSRYYLLLPSSADYTSLLMLGSFTLYGQSQNVSVACDGRTAADLTPLFDAPMAAGQVYELKLFDKGCLIDTVCIIKADCLRTMYIEADHSIEEINEDKDLSVAGTLSMVAADGTVAVDQAALTAFHGRGNTSWYMSGAKKSYTVKLDKKAELIEGAGKAKKWCLVTDNCGGDDVDWVHEAPLLANITAYSMFKAIGGAYAIDYEAINLYVNGRYHGTYLLTEKVEIGKNRISISETEYETEDSTDFVQVRPSAAGTQDKPKNWPLISSEYTADDEDPAIQAGIQAYQYAPGSVPEGRTGGFVLELDRNFYTEGCWFVTSRGYPYTIKEPAYPNRTQVQSIALYVQHFEDAVWAASGYSSEGLYYTEYVDVESAAQKLLIECVTSQTDAFITSCYLTADADPSRPGGFSRIRFGPAWDYDGSNLQAALSGTVFPDGSTAAGTADQKELAQRLFSRGEIAAAMADLSATALRAAFESQTPLAAEGLSGEMDETIAGLTNSQRMNMLIYPNTENDLNRTDDFAGYREAFVRRYEAWYTELFPQSALLGVTLTQRDGVLEAAMYGTVSSFQWYRLDPETSELIRLPGTSFSISGATTSYYTPAESGIYTIRVTGQAVRGSGVSSMYASIAAAR